MNLFDLLKSFFSSKPNPSFNFSPRGQGYIPNVPDYRDISITSVQNPIGAPETTNLITYNTFLKLFPIFDQLALPICVPFAILQLFILYVYRKTGKVVIPSVRFIYKLCKMIDGLPGVSGTTPRAGALIIVNFGAPLESLCASNLTQSEADFLNFIVTDEMNANAEEYKLPGFVSVPINIEAIKEAIHQNGAILGATQVGNWMTLPLFPTPSNGWHYTLWHDYETLPNGDTKIYNKNQWGSGWLAWILGWIMPGYGYFLWSQYQNYVRDIIAFTDIPANFLNKVQSMPYKFTKTLQVGMTDPSVIYLQEMLNDSIETAVAITGAGSPGQETNYFGSATKAAVMKWQQKNNLPSTGFFGPLSVDQANQRIQTMDLINAIIMTESEGDDNAIGDKNLVNHAYGCMQIRLPVVTDVNNAFHTSYKPEDCLGNRQLSITIFNYYMSLYATPAAIGRPVTDEDKARIWNGGPNGWNNSDTVAYWSSVNSKMVNGS